MKELRFQRYVRDNTMAGSGESTYTSLQSLRDIFEGYKLGKVYPLEDNTYLVIKKDEVLIYSAKQQEHLNRVG